MAGFDASTVARFFAKRKERLILYYLAVLLVLLALLVRGSPRINDESAYLLMVASVVKTGAPFIENHLDEINTPELVLHSMTPVVVVGRLTLIGVSPPLYSYLMYLPYVMFGVDGLVMVNLVSFVLSTFLTYHICRKMTGDVSASLYSAVVFSLLTFSIKYSLDIWPHSLAVFLTLLTVALMLEKGPAAAFCAGFFAGLTIGVRYPCILTAFVFSAYLLAYDRWRLTQFLPGFLCALSLLMLAVGPVVSPALASFWNLEGYIKPVALLALTAAAALVAYKILPSNWWVLGNRSLLLALAVAAFFAFSSYAVVFYSQVFDFSFNSRHSELPRKEALLQSSPILLLSVVGVGRMARKVGARYSSLMAALAVVPLLFYTATGLEGGITLMRYFLEAIPFLSVFTGYAIHSLIEDVWPHARDYFFLYYAFIMFSMLATFKLIMHQEVLYLILKVPVLLVFAFLVLYPLRSGHMRALAYLMVCLVVYSFISNMVLIMEDVFHKEYVGVMSAEFEKLLPNGSVILHSGPLDDVSIIPLKAERDLTLAYLERGNRSTNERLIGRYLGRKPIFFLTGEKTSNKSVAKMASEYGAVEYANLTDGNRLLWLTS